MFLELSEGLEPKTDLSHDAEVDLICDEPCSRHNELTGPPSAMALRHLLEEATANSDTDPTSAWKAMVAAEEIIEKVTDEKAAQYLELIQLIRESPL